MSNNPFNNISVLIKNRDSIQNVVDYFSQVFKSHIYGSVENNDRMLSSYFITIFNYIRQSSSNKKEAQSNLDYLYEASKDFIYEKNNPQFRASIFALYLNEKVMTEKWNFLDKISLAEQVSIVWVALSENKIIEKLNYRKIDLSKYLNNKRIYNKELNLKEKALILFLYSSYPQRKSRKAFFEYICEKFPKTTIDSDILFKKLKIERIFSQNFLLLSNEVRQNLNKNNYSETINGKKFIINTEEAIILNVLKISADSLLNYGYFFSPQGGKNTQSNEFIRQFSQYPTIRKILPNFLMSKASRAKSPNNKKFWLELSLDIKEPTIKNVEKRKIKI